MNRRTTPSLHAVETPAQTSAGTRLFTAILSAVFTFLLTGGVGAVPALQNPATKKDDSAADELPPPKIVNEDEWLSIEPFDRLTIAAGQFGRQVKLDVEPLEPRPVPLKPAPGQPTLDPKLRIRLYGGDGTEYEIERNRVLEVQYFEDMLLDQGVKQLGSGKAEKAFDLFRAVAIRNPTWPALNQKIIDFWFSEARRLGSENDERALQILHELKEFCISRNISEPPEVKGQMGLPVGRIVERAFQDKNYVRARHYLFIFESVYPNTPVSSALTQVKDWRKKMVDDTEALVKQAKQKEAADQFRDASYLMLRAADMWPELPNMKEDFRRIYQKYPIMHVAVRELPDRFAPWAPPGSPDARVAHLLHVPLMEVSAIGENSQFSSRILAGEGEIQVEEAGRRLRLNVKPGLRWSDGEKPITAMDLSRSITTLCDSKFASFDAKLAGAVAKVSVPSVNEIVLDLKRSQLRPEMNFLFNLAAGHRLQGDRFTGAGSGPAAVGAGPFRALARQGTAEASIQAGQDLFGRKPKLSEIVERRYKTGRDAVNALLSGDVALVEHVPATQLVRIASRKDLKIAQSSVPALHVISFDFRSRFELHSRTLRRAMAYAIDRNAILAGALLETPPLAEIEKQRQGLDESIQKLEARKAELKPGEFEIQMERLRQGLPGFEMSGKIRKENELVNGPFPKSTYAFDESIKPWPYRAVLAKGLVDVAKKELGVQAFNFELHHPDTDEARDACKFIREYWKLVGIDVTLRPRPTQELEEDVARGVRFELVYRIHYVRDPLLDASRVLCLGQPISREGMVVPNSASPWLRQNLRELELATNWAEAIKKLGAIQLQAHDDVALIPLWQLTDYYAYHERLRGFLDTSLAFYQGAENWQIDPWFRTDAQ